MNARTGRNPRDHVDKPVTNGDGILLRCGKLLVVRTRDDDGAVVDLDRRLESGTVSRYLTDTQPRRADHARAVRAATSTR